MAFDFIVTNATFRPRKMIDRQHASWDGRSRRMCYHTASAAFDAAKLRKKETGNEFSVWVHGQIDPFATTAIWAMIDRMKLIK